MYTFYFRCKYDKDICIGTHLVYVLYTGVYPFATLHFLSGICISLNPLTRVYFARVRGEKL